MPLLAFFFLIGIGADSTRTDTIPPSDPKDILDALQDDAGGADLVESLLWRIEHPFDLNQVTVAELLSLPTVTESEAEALVRYRESVGRFRSIAELRRMPGGGSHALRAISPYVFVPTGGGSEHPVSIRTRVEQLHPADTSAIGSPVHAYSRITTAPMAGVEAGGLFERDAGELSRDAFLSGYISVRGTVPGVDLLVGDFSVEAGQGLLLWRGSGVARTSWTVTTPRKAPLGVIPHASTEEIRFFRGMATSVRVAAGRDRWTGIVFASRRFLPGAYGDGGEVRSVSLTSAFTTTSSAARRSAVRVDVFGMRLLYEHGEGLTAGFTFVRNRFGIPVADEDPARFSGNRLDAAGLDVRFSRFPFLLFGEGATSSGAVALVTGVGMSSASAFSALILYRDYSAKYDNIYADGFGDNGDTRNERGAYVGVALQPASGLSVNAYYDQFRRPGPGTLARFPVAGSEVMVDVTALLAPRTGLTARFTGKSAGIPVTTHDTWGREIREEGRRSEQRWRVGSSVRFEGGIELRSRFEWTSVCLSPGGVEHGCLIAGEFLVRPVRAVSLSARLTFFSTDSYESRLYAFEADLPGLFSSHPLYGRGRRWRITSRLTLSRWCNVSAVVDALEKEPATAGDPPSREIPPGALSHAGLQIDLHW